jgi:colicin import membrane protein
MNRFSKYLVAVALVALFASPLLATNVVGTVKSVNADQNQFVLTDQNGRDWTIQIGQNAQFQINNTNQGRLGDLRPGQTVNVTYELQNNQLVASGVRGRQAQQAAQQAQQPAQQQAQQAAQQDRQGQQGQQAQHNARGRIENVNAEQNQFTLKDEKGHELTFHAGRNARLQVDGKDAKLGDLRQGQEVTVTYRQMLTDIRAGDKNNDANDNAQQQKGQMVRGQIQRVQEAQRQISLRDQNGKEHTFQIGQNTQIQLNGRNATLADLQQGQQVTATRQMVANDVRTGQQNQNQN